MELLFTAMTIMLVAAGYLLIRRFRGLAAQCRKPMAQWLLHFVAANPGEQREMAQALVQESLKLAANMGVQVRATDLLGAASDPAALIDSWRAQLPDVMPATSLSTSPARTLGALMVIRQVQPQRFRQLMGLPATS
ncbi:hypothetical protein D16iCDA_00225 [Pseudomonas seleniipraecipitans]|uniref:Uncharacterized protein n=1 Tax=Phytopseudomonas seleniipraecipitans TaxID=640205 RepID=A0ABY5JBW0_9GAMM|nr:hypothetical protein [Pseudomonas seleniipraecipitans]UUD64178.1 hypothetical protein D16iCDA_00225 [Pseudomonas seleniipraecipitans]